MARKRHVPPIPEELPPCDGPKLPLFEHHDSKIEWLERLGDSGDVAHEGYVFRVKIKRAEYAIKVFKFYDPMESEYFWEPLIGDVSLHTAAYYTDPFYNECRAYGRIREAIRKRPKISDAATHCHGFLFLGDRDQRHLEEKKCDLGLERVDLAYQRQTAGGVRPRAIVKSLASSDHGVAEPNLRKILDRIHTLNRERIYNLDVRLENIKDGRLVDFGSSWTEPHILLNKQDAGTAYSYRTTDRVMFDEMLVEETISNPRNIVAMHSMTLRPRYS
ncbi:unnamed protein product [Clonostachys rosea f. rosea IK726]|uniref:Uncharacterized protein n=1 Tax=Clonostachys rosea f. rosea IK726 TaxID=1349383 RepID=A0ACA9UR50_BIOOC|nr:unnamed protein product [Clonostachys rosea f. rosea IK726]